MSQVKVWYLLFAPEGELVNRCYCSIQAKSHLDKHEDNQVRVLQGKGKSFKSYYYDTSKYAGVK